MNQFDADILRKLNGQQYWDIEELWEGWQLNIATMERFDSEEWIEIRLNGIGPNGCSTAQTPTIVQGDWFSPHKHCEPWQKYFIVDSDDVRPRWRERCLQQIGFLMYENTSHTDFYTSEKRSPCELKLATKGRIALAQSAVTTQPDQGRMPEPQIRDKDDVQVVEIKTPQIEPALDPTLYITARDIATKFDIPYDSLRQKLIRWQRNHFDDFKEATDRKPREAKYLYRVGAVIELVNNIKQKLNSETTSE